MLSVQAHLLDNYDITDDAQSSVKVLQLPNSLYSSIITLNQKLFHPNTSSAVRASAVWIYEALAESQIIILDLSQVKCTFRDRMALKGTNKLFCFFFPTVTSSRHVLTMIQGSVTKGCLRNISSISTMAIKTASRDDAIWSG